MKLLFGWELDGHCYPETLSGEFFGIDEQIVGQDLLVTSLQTRLGLRRRQDPQPVRIAKYFAALDEIDDGGKFFSKSFARDGWSTAEHLLAMRDDLVAAGWNGESSFADHDVLRTLAEIESSGIDLYCRLVDGVPELIAAIEARRCPVLDELLIAHDVSLLPTSWQKLIESMRRTGTVVASALPYRRPPSEKSDLSLLQDRLFSSRRSAESGFISGDRSVCLLRAANEYEAADAVASWLSAGTPEENTDTVIIRGDGVSLLDNACSRQGLPRIGGEYTASSRWIAQVLPLCFEICWEPTDLYKLMDFLNLPDLPVPRTVAFALSQALRHEPGQDNPHWHAALDKAILAHVERAENRPASEQHRLFKRVSREVTFWTNPQLADEHEGIESGFVLRRTSALRDWTIKRFHSTNEDIYGAIATLCTHLRNIVIALGRPRLTRPLFDRMMSSVMEQGIPKPSGGAEASPWTPIYTPGQLWAEAHTVVWWSFIAPPVDNLRLWSSDDIGRFAQLGIQIETAEQRAKRTASLARNAVRYASEKLLLVYPETIEGQATAIHPLWYEIADCFQKTQLHVESSITQRAGNIYLEEKPELAGRQLNRELGKKSRKPDVRRSHQVPLSAVTLPASIPVTALETLVACPFAFVMRNILGLRSTSLLDVPDGEQLIGTFAHAIVATVLNQLSALDPEAAKKEAIKLVDANIGAAAIPLLAKHRASERMRTREQIGNAVAHLISFLRDNELSICAVEVDRKKNLGQIEIEGRIDLVVQDQHGRRLVVDHKWTKAPLYRVRELEENRAIQLASYAWFEAEESSSYPNVAYNLLRQNQMCSSKDDEDSLIERLWKDIEIAVDDLMNELRSGTIIATGIVPDSESELSNTVSIIEPPCKICRYSNLCGRASIIED